MSYIDELTEKHGEHFVFSATGNGMRTACAEVDSLRAQLAETRQHCNEAIAQDRDIRAETLRARLAVADAELAEAREENVALRLQAVQKGHLPCWQMVDARDAKLDAANVENAALRGALEPLIKYAHDSKLIALSVQHFEEAARVKALAVAGEAALHPATKEGKA